MPYSNIISQGDTRSIRIAQDQITPDWITPDWITPDRITPDRITPDRDRNRLVSYPRLKPWASSLLLCDRPIVPTVETGHVSCSPRRYNPLGRF